jgi:tetratricopeptide (TPR) repeat protein
MPYFERALQYRREHGYRRGIAMALANLGLVKYYLGESSVCLDYAYEAVNLIEKVAARPNKARILSYLGHIQLGLGELDQATESYQRALSLRRELGQSNLALEPLAGLVEAFWRSGDLPQAYSYVESIFSYLEARSKSDPLEVVLAGLDDPVQVYLSCYHVLSAKQSSAVERAPMIPENEVLDVAIQLLKRRSAEIEDEQQRALFIENVPAHREIHEISRSRLESNLGLRHG